MTFANFVVFVLLYLVIGCVIDVFFNPNMPPTKLVFTWGGFFIKLVASLVKDFIRYLRGIK